MEQKSITIALIYDFDGTLSPGNMQEYDFIPAVGKSNKEFWTEANTLAEEQDADMVIFIRRPDYVGLGETPDGKETTQIIIAKHRNGEVCDIDMLFKAEQVRFVEPGDTLAARAEEMGGTESAMNSAMNNEFDNNTEF